MAHISSSSVLRVVFAISLMTGVFPPLLPAIQEEFALTATRVSLLLTLFGVTRLLIDVPAGRLVRSYSPALLLTGATVAGLIGGLGAALAPSYSVLLLSRVFVGIASAVSVVIGLSTLARVSASPNAAMSHFYIAMFSALIVSPTIGGLFDGLWGWRSAIAAISAVVGVAALESGRRLRGRDLTRIRDGSPASAAATRLVRTRPVLMIYGLSFVSLALYTGAKLTLLPLYGANHLDLSVTEIGLIFTATAVLTPATMLATARITAPERKALCIAAGLAVWVLGLGVMLTPSVITFVAASACFDLAGGLMYATPYALLTDCIPRGAVGQAMGEVRLPADVAWLVTPPVVGMGIDMAGVAVPLAMMIGVAVASLVCVRLFLTGAALRRAITPDLEIRLTRTG